MSDAKTYHVRQYRPAYFSGFDNEVVRDVPYDKILEASWLGGFKHDDFTNFTIEPYGDELIVSAHYACGKHWVAAFATDSAGPMAENWRYVPGGQPT